MKTRLQERFETLKAEYEDGKKMLAELDAKRQNLSTSLLRIEGAMHVLQEMIDQEGGAPATERKPLAPVES
ncbi:hypothetical protein [Hyalangium sp.]|uniref:hypothetical protein n=1 Tax=Hyalangium sp. TaxID=2028555 RepID=UPI002D6E5D55|nr:hypothetical protein [Hyalangium sp.]HYI02939.1 hypothetical protein [Hyalangium sp.]